MTSGRAQYLWYMAGVTCFVIPSGIQTIVFPWLIAVQLKLGAELLGIAQMSMQLPALALILIGGLVADRVDGRKILIVLHLLACMPAAVLALTYSLGQLSYGAMIAYAVAIGTISAFVQPARDSMLNRISTGNLQQTVTVTMGLSFGAQIFGVIAASSADTTGPVPLLLLHSGLMLVGAFAAWHLNPAPPWETIERRPGSNIRQIKDGLGLVFNSERMRPATIMVMFMSAFYGGTFIVLNPIIVRDIYDGDAVLMSLSFGAFMLGTILMTVVLVASGGINRHGRGLLLAIIGGAVCLLVASTEGPFWMYLGCLFFWGIGGAVAMSMSRTIMQESAPAEYRARVMSVFSLANMGGMPVGALLMGYIAAYLGPLTGIVVAAAVASSVAVILALTTPLWRIEQHSS